MASPKVAVLRTSPESVFEDYARLLDLAEYTTYLPKTNKTALKINISWEVFYPGCSTTPWQLDAVIKKMIEDGYDVADMYGCHNRTVVVDGEVGEVLNRHKCVTDKYGIPSVHIQPKDLKAWKRLVDDGEWVKVEPKGEMLMIPETFPDGQYIPKHFYGENVIHFPTMKTHVHTTMTGAMKNAFGAMLHHERHWAHGRIHECLVDLLVQQKEIFGGLFAVMDGSFAGSGAGPRTMHWHEADVILASADQVAIDAVAAKLMGFEPMDIKFIRLAHERGLGVGEFDEIELVGDDVSGMNLGFSSGDNMASKGQKALYGGMLKPVEHLLMHTWLVPWSYLASRLYHDVFWLNAFGKKRIRAALKTKWGKMFQQYPATGVPDTPLPNGWDAPRGG